MMRDVRALSNRCCERIFLGSERRMLTWNTGLRPVRKRGSKPASSNNPHKGHISGVKLARAASSPQEIRTGNLDQYAMA